MKKIFITALFLLAIQTSVFAAATPEVQPAQTLAETAQTEKQNFETAQVGQLYYIPNRNRNPFKVNYTYKMKIVPQSGYKSGDRVITEPHSGPMYTFYVTSVNDSTVYLLLESGPLKEVNLFTPLVLLEI